ncbi:hypothetical protein [Paenibacillus durus]|uniref:hypothetical protein n=1 Tax=Paenibacillus durus TaxID=44251 RepID=UPI0009DF4D38|nr:hypothetical protein [Paenibacillus durus]
MQCSCTRFIEYEHYFEEVKRELGVPVVYNADIGHVPPQLTLVNGALTAVDADSKTTARPLAREF